MQRSRRRGPHTSRRRGGRSRWFTIRRTASAGPGTGTTCTRRRPTSAGTWRLRRATPVAAGRSLSTTCRNRWARSAAPRWSSLSTAFPPRPTPRRGGLGKPLMRVCPGLAREARGWIFEFGGLTPEGALATLGTMQPTSKFGEMFQYSNPMAGAAGFTAGHVLFPGLELGAAYDRAMQAQVFDPLGMTATTFDFSRALAADHAIAHAPDVDGKPALAVMEVNYAVI